MKYIFLSFFIAVSAGAVEKKLATPEETKKKLSFDSQLVEGEVYRPDYSVVTGERPGEGWGLLRMRDNFQDHAATDAEEKMK
jgi:hypothetical protein